MRWGFMALVGLFGLFAATPLYAQAANISLAWNDTANTVHDGYIIQRRPNVAGSPYVEVGRTPKTVMTYADGTVVDSQAYCFVVLAYRTTPPTLSPPSNEACGMAGTVLMAPVNTRLVP